METLIDIYNNKRKTEMKRIILSTMLLLATFATVVAQDLDSKYATNLLKNGTVAPEFTLRTADEQEAVSYTIFNKEVNVKANRKNEDIIQRTM